MSLQDFKVLAFDVVGTLIDFERGIIDYVREVPGADASRLGDDAILEAYRRSRNFAGRDGYPDDLVRGYAAMAKDLGLPTGPGLGEGLRDSVRAWPAFPDSAAALERLRRRFKLVAMTNAQRWALAHMEKTLGWPFHDTVTVDDARAEKPDPQFFAFARGRLSAQGYRLEDILHVAQSQYHDIGVARKLGYTVCWIERRRGMKGFGGTQVVPELTRPDYHFATLAQLADAVEAESRVG
ncbi:MAG: HAD-IA family hydrolase [Pseudomonadota bacterium]